MATSDWRKHAACNNTPINMVPDAPEETRIAKKTCASCPVLVSCLLHSEQLAQDHGRDYVQGIWGGLTERERAAMANLGRWPRPCSQCGLDCVPINETVTECSACNPEARIRYDEYRPAAERLVQAGASFEDLSQTLSLSRSALADACRRWGIKPKRSRAQNPDLMPCGTLAAKYRHHRRERDSWKRCPACRAVPWNKGKPKPSEGGQEAAPRQD